MVTPKKIGAQTGGELVYDMADFIEEPPDLSDLLEPLGLNHAAFLQWLAVRIARYRMWQRGREDLHTYAAVKRWLMDVKADIHAAAADGRLMHLEPRADPFVWYEAYKDGVDWRALADRASVAPADRDLALVALYIERAILKLQQQPPSRGRRNAQPRDQLLADVMLRLREAGATVERASSLAVEILRKCRVPVPAEDSVKRAARRGKK